MIEFRELRMWMRRNKVGLRELALKAGLDKTTLWRVLNGQIKTCSRKVVEAIIEATDGEIGIEEIRAFERRLERRRASALSS